MKDISSSEIVEDEEHRQYHIALAPGEIASHILLVGDPARASKVAKFFDSIKLERTNREFITYTGIYKGLEVSVMSTGIGPSNVEIAVIELSRILDNNNPINIIRVGSCGALLSKINVADLIISTGAVRLEDTSLYFVDQSFPAIANFEIVQALIQSADNLAKVDTSFKYYSGITATGSGFYGAQGRDIPNFPVKDKTMHDKLGAWNVLNFEMESSTLFTLAHLANIKAGTVCVVYANRPNGTFIPSNMKDKAEERVIHCGLEALLISNKMDKIKKEKHKNYWHSGLST